MAGTFRKTVWKMNPKSTLPV